LGAETALFIPTDNSDPDFKGNITWKILILVPIIFYAITLAIFFFYLKYDSIIFNLKKKDNGKAKQEAISMIKIIYPKE